MSKKQESEDIPAVAGGKTTDINEVKNTLDSEDISNEKKFNLLEQVLSDTSLDKHEKLDSGIRYLNNLKDIGVEKYIFDSSEIMRKLHDAFQGDELYKPWVRYFDVSCKVEGESIKEEERSIFTSGISTLVQELLFENGNDQIDWRIIKKMLEVSDILFEEDTIDIFQQEDLFKPIKVGIEKAIEFLLWKDPNIAVDSTKLTINTLKILKDHFDNQNTITQLKEAILSSRFDKDEFELTNTVIMGEDGGMYLLLNNLTGNKQIFKEVASDDYINDKLPKDPLSQKGKKQQITIGEGGFGTVRFALSLFDAKSKPGDLICIKKTKSIGTDTPKGVVTYERVIDGTLKDYFTNDVAGIIYAPSVFDMALVTDRDFVGHSNRKGYLMMEVLPQNTATKVFKEKKYQKWEYQKPYLLDVFQKILDLLGQNIAMTDLKPDNTLYDTDTRKATIIDLGGSVRVENEEEITKFDICKYYFQKTDAFCAKELQQKKGVIDISKALAFACGKIIGAITEELIDRLTNIINIVENIKKGSVSDIQTEVQELIVRLKNGINDITTDGYTTFPQEHCSQVQGLIVRLKNGINDITTDGDATFPQEHCSQVQELIVKLTNIINDIIEKGITTPLQEHRPQVKELINCLTEENLEKKRISIQDAIKVVEEIGDDSYKENIIFAHYISKIKERLKDNKSSIGINEDIETLSDEDIRELVSNKNIKNTESLYIDLYTTKLDPYRYANLTTDILSEKIDGFWSGSKEVMLLLGVAGAGKSITLQLKFIKAVKEWKIGDPLPIYFNLASNIDLVKIIDSLNNELGTNLKLNDLKNAHLYIDSFDEGLGIATKREILIKDYIEKLGNPKILISCRTDYLPDGNNYNWFMPESKQLEVYYIAPINYSEKQKLENYISNYVQYVTKCSDETYNNEETRDTEYYLDKIAKLKIAPIIDTGFMFEIVMHTIPSIHVSSTIEKPISRQDIYDEYLKIKQGGRIANLHEKQKDKIDELLSNLNIAHNENTKELELNHQLKELGKYIATALHLQNIFRIKGDSELFKAFGYEKSSLFKQQALYHILKLLPLKIETKTSKSKIKIEQEVEIGFAHVIFKNYYLFEAIKDEVKKSGKSAILASHSIVKDVELIKLIAEDIVYNKNLQKFLRQSIDGTKHKQNKSDEAVTFASNSITLLVAAQYSFSGEDLSNIAIRGANIRNGIFQYVDFSGADLTGVNLTNANLVKVKFIGTNMESVELSVYPDLKHNTRVHCISYSPDGKYLASSYFDGTLRIWNAENGSLLQNLIGYTNNVWYIISYSPDGKYLASSSSDRTVKIWHAEDLKNTESNSSLKTLKGHADSIQCIIYSPDGKYLASGSSDRTVKIWYVEDSKKTESNSSLKTLGGHTSGVRCISYSPDGKYLASGSWNQIIIWNTKDGKSLKPLEGHTSGASCISYSPDGKCLALGSDDQIVKIWNAENGSLLQNLIGHTESIQCVSYSPNGKYLTSGSLDKTVKIWNAENGSLLQNLIGHIESIQCISYSHDGKYLASGSFDGMVKIWNVTSFNEKLLQNLIGHTNSVTDISYSPDGKYLASGSSDGTVKIWYAENGSLLQNLTGHNNSVMISYSPDGKYLASSSDDQTVKIWKIENGSLLQNLIGHTDNDNVLCIISYSPDGKYLASSFGNTVKIWSAEYPENLRNDRLLQNLIGHTDDVTNISYSPDGKYLASCSFDGTVKIWHAENPENAESDRLLKTLGGDTDSLRYVISYSPNGKYLASNFGNTVKIWDAKDSENDRSLKTLEGHTESIWCISYSPNGKYLASGSCDGTVKIWDAENPENAESDRLLKTNGTVKIWHAEDYENNRSLKTLEGHTERIRCISYSPDGKYLASSSCNTVKIWSAEYPRNDSLPQNLIGHTDSVGYVIYSPDGKHLVSESYDNTIKIWEKKTDPQSQEVVWCTIREISATESPLVCEDATIKEAIISAKNQAIFEQKGAIITNNTIDNTENKEVHSNEINTSKQIDNQKPHALLKEKLEVADKQKTLKLVKVKFIILNALTCIKYDNPLLNNPMLLKKLASNLNININQAIDASNHCTNLFGSKDFNYICNSDQSLLQELLGNYCEY